MNTRDLYNKARDYSKDNLVTILVVALAISSLLVVYFYRQAAYMRANLQGMVQLETAEMLARVSELIVLPENEKPTIATVTDPELLKGQPFFAHAQKGYKVLIYPNAGKSILYDPFNNRIVEVASINIGNQAEPSPFIAP